MSWAPGEPVYLRTERFALRSLVADHAGERYVRWLNDEEVMRFVNARFAMHDIASVRAFIQEHDDRTSFLVGVFEREGDTHIGNLEALVDPHHAHAHIGVLIGERDWWGRGVVLETRATLLDFLFDEVGVVKVCGQCYASNRAMLFNYQAQGFETEGVLRSHVVLDGGRDDVVQFGMARDAWRARAGRARTTSEPHDRARTLLAEALGLAPERILADAGVATLRAWDSLAHVRLVLRVTEELGRPLTPEEVLEIRDLAGLAGLLGSA